MNPESMIPLGTVGIPGVRLKTSRPDVIYNVLQFRDGNTLVLQVVESPNTPPSEPTPTYIPPTQLAELRIERGTLPRVLDVLESLSEALGKVPEMRTRLSNLEGAIPDDFMERY